MKLHWRGIAYIQETLSHIWFYKCFATNCILPTQGQNCITNINTMIALPVKALKQSNFNDLNAMFTIVYGM